ncbi:MAG: sugar phosphate isomerase/epimerase [Chloroflexi bacterium AL-W]|nr:sugar phosphate isomerase/epimerase [Chloroflexi bacterium AL-N1]NOK64726.1 sugar phosphate isomerase/epimerase [Chloroflexi bacterium AL-N10]NOK75967.1 sugar phosphate isomerase/epimerase [Chloroflexi bacterium AL-N5]NOK80274.1 sugar phosphate isomerase/epimerase [Chloroflexi bacterium AL-W]NOK86787.1 sugar phosphate isomerase/epimerase [Chloroflexi bacterium AL-N15]
MTRPVTLFTGQWADLPLETLATKVKGWGFDGLELACWGDHFEVTKALESDGYVRQKREFLERHGLQCFAISNHLVGQAVCDAVIDERHKGILPPHVWGDGDPEGVRQRAAEEIKNTARAAAAFGVKIVNGFTGSKIWHVLAMFPPVPPQMIEDGYQDFANRWNPILDVFDEVGVKFALEVHPSEIAYDYWTTQRTLEAINHREAFGINFDPSHLYWQMVDPVEFVYGFKDRIYHMHVKESIRVLNGRNGILGSHLLFGDQRRGWDFVSPGRGGVPFERVFRALNDIGYEGPYSIEWEDNGMSRDQGAPEALQTVRNLEIVPSNVAFDAAFQQK